VVSSESTGDFLKEIHIVTFPDEQALSAYRNDEDLKEVVHLREESVVKTEILVGEDGPDYAAAD